MKNQEITNVYIKNMYQLNLNLNVKQKNNITTNLPKTYISTKAKQSAEMIVVPKQSRERRTRRVSSRRQRPSRAHNPRPRVRPKRSFPITIGPPRWLAAFEYVVEEIIALMPLPLHHAAFFSKDRLLFPRRRRWCSPILLGLPKTVSHFDFLHREPPRRAPENIVEIQILWASSVWRVVSPKSVFSVHQLLHRGEDYYYYFKSRFRIWRENLQAPLEFDLSRIGLQSLLGWRMLRGCMVALISSLCFLCMKMATSEREKTGRVGLGIGE